MGHYLTINFGDPEPIVVDFTGFSDRDEKGLMSVIIEEAKLKWQPRTDPYTEFRGDGDWVRRTSSGLAEIPPEQRSQ